MLTERLFGRGQCVLVLYYHRVAELPHDPQCLAVLPPGFRDQMHWLKQNTTPISLEGLVSTLRGDQRLPRRGVVVTFDDGYADNLHVGMPILKDFQIPATVFVTTGVIGTNREFWWDDLERILLQTDPLRKALQFNIAGQTVAWSAATTGDRERLYDLTLRAARALSADSRDALLTGLSNWAGVSRGGRESHRALKSEELRMLDAEPLITIGVHTVSHSMLSALPGEEQEKEIVGGKAALENMLGHDVTLFSYPFGQKGDYNDESIDQCCAAGFACACTTRRGVIRKGFLKECLFELPRFCVRNWDVKEFARQVEAWFHD